MANTNLKSVKLKLVYSEGLVNGKEKLSSKTFSNVNKTVGNDAYFTVANTIFGMQNKTKKSIAKIEETEITE